MNNEKETKGGNSSALAIKRQEESIAGLGVLNLLDKEQYAAAENVLGQLIRSEKGGIKTIQDGIAMIVKAQDLRLPFSACLEHIHVINGKTGVDVHIIKALLLRAGVTWKCTKDYAPQYQYTDGDNVYNETQLPEYCVKCRTAKEAEEKTTDEVIGVYPVKYYTDLSGKVYNQFQISDKCVICINKQQAKAVAESGKFPVIRTAAKPIDYVCEYEFTRFKLIYGQVIKQEATSHFSYSEAQAADMFKKDTYRLYPRIMISHRAFVYGARDIADDVIMGLMETTELKSINDIELVPEDCNYEELTTNPSSEII